jgi:hypothetical protein
MTDPRDHTMEPPDSMMAKIRRKLQEPVSRIVLYMIGGTLVWAFYVMLVYPLTSLTCHWNWFGAPVDGSGLKITQTLATVIAIGLVAVFGFASFKEWQRTRTQESSEEGETKAAVVPMLAFVTLLLNGLYLLIIVVSLAPIFVLPVCA